MSRRDQRDSQGISPSLSWSTGFSFSHRPLPFYFSPFLYPFPHIPHIPADCHSIPSIRPSSTTTTTTTTLIHHHHYHHHYYHQVTPRGAMVKFFKHKFTYEYVL